MAGSGAPFFEPEGNAAIAPIEALIGCIEREARALLIEGDRLPAAFFELRTGVAGEMVQKLVNYGLRMAVVLPDLATRSERFREFAREANAGRQFRFFATRPEAVAWLERAGGPG